MKISPEFSRYRHEKVNRNFTTFPLYAVVYPFAEGFGLSKGMTLALLTPVVLIAIFAVVRHMRDRIDQISV